MQVISVNLTKALAGDQADDVLLQPKDAYLFTERGQIRSTRRFYQGEVAAQANIL